MNAPTLKLYYSPLCGYCHLVFREADQLGIPLERVNVNSDAEARNRLQEVRGRTTVPVLSIGELGEERLLGESRDIIDYLRNLANA